MADVFPLWVNSHTYPESSPNLPCFIYLGWYPSYSHYRDFSKPTAVFMGYFYSFAKFPSPLKSADTRVSTVFQIQCFKHISELKLVSILMLIVFYTPEHQGFDTTGHHNNSVCVSWLTNPFCTSLFWTGSHSGGGKSFWGERDHVPLTAPWVQ